MGGIEKYEKLQGYAGEYLRPSLLLAPWYRGFVNGFVSYFQKDTAGDCIQADFKISINLNFEDLNLAWNSIVDYLLEQSTLLAEFKVVLNPDLDTNPRFRYSSQVTLYLTKDAVLNAPGVLELTQKIENIFLENDIRIGSPAFSSLPINSFCSLRLDGHIADAPESHYVKTLFGATLADMYLTIHDVKTYQGAAQLLSFIANLNPNVDYSTDEYLYLEIRDKNIDCNSDAINVIHSDHMYEPSVSKLNALSGVEKYIEKPFIQIEDESLLLEIENLIFDEMRRVPFLEEITRPSDSCAIRRHM